MYKIRAIVVCLVIFIGSAMASMSRNMSPVIIKAESLSAFNGLDKSGIKVMSYSQASNLYTAIPFQYDEFNSEGEWLYAENEVVDDTDEIVFMAKDAGDKVTGDNIWPSDEQAQSNRRYEIAVNDSYTGETGYVYIFFSETLSLNPTRYISYDNDIIDSDVYTLGHDPKVAAGMPTDLLIKGNNVDFLDSWRFRALFNEIKIETDTPLGKLGVTANDVFIYENMNEKVKFSNSSAFLNLEFEIKTFQDGDPIVKSGPIRVLRANPFSISLEEPISSFSKTRSIYLHSIYYPDFSEFYPDFKLDFNSISKLESDWISFSRAFDIDAMNLKFYGNDYRNSSGSIDNLINNSSTNVFKSPIGNSDWPGTRWCGFSGQSSSFVNNVSLMTIVNLYGDRIAPSQDPNTFFYDHRTVSSSYDQEKHTVYGVTGLQIFDWSYPQFASFDLQACIRTFYYNRNMTHREMDQEYIEYKDEFKLSFDSENFVDEIAPANITDLTIVAETDKSVTLSWTAPGDDGMENGPVKFYLFRYSHIDPNSCSKWDWWREATQLSSPEAPIPIQPGLKHSFTVNVPTNQTLYFRIRVGDDANPPNYSDLSNVAITNKKACRLVFHGPLECQSGDEFWLEVKFDESGGPINDLFGTSYVINYQDTKWLDALSIDDNTGFLGDDLLTFSDIDDDLGRISIGASRKSTPGVDGYGILTRIQFAIPDNTPDGTTLQFSLSDLNFIDSAGNPLAVESESYVIQVSKPTVAPDSSLLVISGPSECQSGDDFWIDIKFDSSAVPVSDLFGSSFVLNYQDTQWLDVVEPHGSNVLAGEMLGSSPVFFSDVDDAAGEVSLGVSRKSGAGGVNGYGRLARVHFTVPEKTPDGTTLQFNLRDLNFIDSAGNPIAVETNEFSIHVTKPVVAPDSSLLVISGPSECQSGDDFWLDVRFDSSASPVNDLFGSSFVLNYQDTQWLDVVEPHGSNVLAGQMLGSSPVFFSDVDDAAGEVSLGVSRKSGAGGVNGYGRLARVHFAVPESTPDGTLLQFSLADLNFINSIGSPIAVETKSFAIKVSKPTVAPDSSLLVISGPSECQSGDDFWIDIKFDSSAVPVSDLFGSSFVLNYQDTQWLDVVEPHGSNVLAGEMLGSSPVFFSDVDDAAGEVSLGVSRKSGVGGVNGYGRLARVHFTVPESTPDGTLLQFSLSDLNFINSIGSAIAVETKSFAIKVSKPTVAPDSSLLVISGPSECQSGDDFWIDIKFDSSAVPVSDLFGSSFVLNYQDTQWLDVVEPHGSNVLAGEMLGSSPVFFSDVDDAAGEVSLGVSRKAGQDGVSGCGCLARIHFTIPQDVPNGTVLKFELSEVNIANSYGNMLSVQLENHEIKIENSQTDTGTLALSVNPPSNALIYYELIVAIQDVEDLFGVSFKVCAEENNKFVEMVNVLYDGVLGADVLKFDSFEDDGRIVNIGMSLKAGQSGFTGSGELCRIQFITLENAPEIFNTSFQIQDAIGSKSNGETINLQCSGFSYMVSVENRIEQPSKFVLFPNHPNPFNPSTTIKFDIPEMSDVRLEIVNINGKLVRTLVNEHKQAGSYSVVWDATDNSGCAVASGVYLYRLQAGGEVLTKKLLYTK